MAFNNTDLQKLLNEGKVKTIISYGGNTGLRAKKLSNRVSFQVNKRLKGGKNTSTIIGYYPDISLKEALNKTQAIRIDIDAGLNPRIEKIKRQSEVSKGLKTLDDCIQIHIMDKESARTTPIPENTIRQTWSAFRLCSPKLLNKPIAEITADELRDCFNFMASSQYKNRNGSLGARRQAEIWMSYTKAVFKMAHEIKDFITVNPCPKAFYKITREIKSYDHFLQPSEVSKMIELINDMEEYQKGFAPADVFEARLTQYQAVKLTVLTGLRNASELYTIKWSDVNLGTNKPTFYYTTSKQQQPLEIPITPIMREVFKAQAKRKYNDYVFAGTMNAKETNTHIKGVHKAMVRLREIMADKPHNMKQFQNSEVFNNLMLRHTFTTLGNRIGIPIEKLDAMSGHIQTTQRKVATTQYISRIAEDMREDFIKLHDFMLAGKDFEDQDMSEETIKLKHKSLVARLNTPRARVSLQEYFNKNYPASYIGQATRIVKISKHYYVRFFDDVNKKYKSDRFKKEGRTYDPIFETTGYLVELPKWITNSFPDYRKRDLYTIFVVKEFPENRSNVMKEEDISEQEVLDGDIHDHTTGIFRTAHLQDEIRIELGDTYRNKDYYQKMPEKILEERKASYTRMVIRMGQRAEIEEAKGKPRSAYSLLSPQEKWERVFKKGRDDMRNLYMENEEQLSAQAHLDSSSLIRLAKIATTTIPNTQTAKEALKVLVPLHDKLDKDWAKNNERLEEIKQRLKPSSDSTT